jgi:hypothetical protein
MLDTSTTTRSNYTNKILEHCYTIGDNPNVNHQITDAHIENVENIPEELPFQVRPCIIWNAQTLTWSYIAVEPIYVNTKVDTQS